MKSARKLNPENNHMTAPQADQHLILSHSNPLYVASARFHLRQLGWNVHEASSGAEARRLACRFGPAVMILEAEATPETGWLTCAKLLRELPECSVILVGREPDSEDFRLTEFVGAAALVVEEDGVRALLQAVDGAVSLPTG